MQKHNPANERVKRDYLEYLEQAKRMSTSSVDQVAAAIASFEASTGFKDFRKFSRQQAIAFKDRMQTGLNSETGKQLAKATIHSRLMALKAFVHWLQGRPGFRSRITYDDAEYFNPSANDERIAKAHRQKPVPTLEEIRIAFDELPSVTVVDRRDRAVFALAIVSGARDSALASFALKHVDVARRLVFQDAREVRTKNAKTFTSKFFPVDPAYSETLADWILELRSLGFGENEPMLPATAVEVGPDKHFVVVGIRPEFWKTASPIRRIFAAAFARVGLPYYNPHSFRSTLAIHGERICTTPEEWKAYSQNFGHTSPMTTFNSYGPVAPHRQAEILEAMCNGRTLPAATAIPVRLDPDQLGLIIDGLAKKMVPQE